VVSKVRSRVAATSAFVVSLLIAQLLVVSSAHAAPPPAPTNLAATATHSFNSHLTWVDHSGATAQYIVNNASVDSKPQRAGSTSFDWGGQSPNTHMCFTVRAVTSGGTSPAAGPVCTTTPAATCSPTTTVADASGFVDFYHGTSLAFARTIRDDGIDLSKGNPDTDFGRGFYITTDLRQAREWATKNFSGSIPTVIHYRVTRSQLTPGGLCGLVFPSGNADFATFVRWFRDNAPPLGGAGYDFVEGPLLLNPSDFRAGLPPRTAGQQDSIHSARAVAIFDAGFVELLDVPAVKVMVVGDSISQGSAGDFTWRYQFYRHETATAGVRLDLVGPRDDLFDNVANTFNDNHTYVDPAFDQDHDAIWGRTLADAATAIQSTVQAYAPDYLLVLLGINDLVWGVGDPAGTEARLRTFIAQARAANPDQRFVFGVLLPNTRMATDAALAAAVADYNTRLRQAVAELSTSDSPMVIAETGADFVPGTDTWDGLHPNARGDVKIAAAFADALAGKFDDHSHGPGFGTPYPRPYPNVPIGPQTAPELTVAPDDASATLSWTLSPGATGYYVYVKNVTAGETTFTKLPNPPPGPTWVATSLVNGSTYQFQLGTTKGTAEGVLSNIASVTVGPPTPPTNLTATPNPDGTIGLSWNSSGSGVWYWVYMRKVGVADFTKIVWPVGSGTSSTVGGLDNGQAYEFRVSALGSHGAESAPSNIARATARRAPPPAPTNLTATANPDATIALSWDSSGPGTWYWVETRDVTKSESFTRLPNPNTTGTFTATMLTVGDTYEYRVIAIGPDETESPPSNTARATAAVAPPAAPTNLTATANSDGTVTLNWRSSNNDSWYWLYLRNATDGQPFGHGPYPVTTGTSFTQGGLLSGKTYEFRITAIGAGGGESAPSNTASAVPTVAPPGAPTNLRAVPGDSQATLTWNSSGAGVWYWIYTRTVPNGSFARMTYPVTTGTTFTVTMLANGTTYEYYVTAIGSGGTESPRSNIVQVIPQVAAPPTPANLTATANGDGTIRLSWNSSGAGIWYWVYMRTGTSGNFTRLQYPATATSFTAGFLTVGQTYSFRVSAFNAGGESPPSNTAQATAWISPPPAPSLSATPLSDGRIQLNWTSSGSGIWYWIELKDVYGNNTWTRLQYPVGNGTSFIVAAVRSGSTYDFRVVPIYAGGDGPASNVVRITSQVARPTGLTARWTERTRVSLSWNASNPTGVFWVYIRDVSNNGNWTRQAYPVSGQTWATITPLLSNTYDFYVTQVTGQGESDPSTVARASAPFPTPAPGSVDVGLGTTPISCDSGTPISKRCWTTVIVRGTLSGWPTTFQYAGLHVIWTIRESGNVTTRWASCSEASPISYCEQFTSYVLDWTNAPSAPPAANAPQICADLNGHGYYFRDPAGNLTTVSRMASRCITPT